MYHVTPTENVESILEDGLQSKKLNMPIYKGMYGAEDDIRYGVYVTKNREDAERYAEWMLTECETDDIAVLGLDITVREHGEYIFRDPEADMCGDTISKSGRVVAANITPPRIEKIARVREDIHTEIGY